MANLVTEGLPDQVAASLAAFVPGVLKLDVVSGAGSSTNIAVTGYALEDSVIGAVFFPKEGGAPAKLTLVATTAGNIKTATDTTGGKIVFLWQDKSNG